MNSHMAEEKMLVPVSCLTFLGIELDTVQQVQKREHLREL